MEQQPPQEPQILPVDNSAVAEVVESPAKLLRIGSMVREMLAEVRRAPLDEAGRAHLREVHERAMGELKEILSPDLREELDDVAVAFGEGIPTESELRIAQAQLVGWLEGVFHGIQAALWTQQMAAQQQLGQLRRHALEPGGPDQPAADGGAGQYL